MTTGLETTQQQLLQAYHQRKILQGALSKRLYTSPDQCMLLHGSESDPGGFRNNIEELLLWASKENALRQRLWRKDHIAKGRAVMPPRWQLRTALTYGGSAVFKLVEPVTLAGRGPQCSLTLPLPAISRRHLVLTSREECLAVQDLQSSNGIHVNGVTVQEAALHAGDTLKIGNVTFVVECCEPVKTEDPLPSKEENPVSGNPERCAPDNSGIFIA